MVKNLIKLAMFPWVHLRMSEWRWSAWMELLSAAGDFGDTIVVIFMANVTEWTRSQENVTVGQLYKAQPTWSESNRPMILVQESWNLIWVLRAWRVGEKCSGLCKVHITWRKIWNGILSGINASIDAGTWSECSRVGMVVVMSFVHRILLHNSSVVGNVGSLKVVGCSVVDVTVPFGVNWWLCGWWRCDVRRNSIVDSVKFVEDMAVSNVVKTENVCELRLRVNRPRSRSHIRHSLIWWRWWWANNCVLIAIQSPFTLHSSCRRLKLMWRACCLRMNDC